MPALPQPHEIAPYEGGAAFLTMSEAMDEWRMSISWENVRKYDVHTAGFSLFVEWVYALRRTCKLFASALAERVRLSLQRSTHMLPNTEMQHELEHAFSFCRCLITNANSNFPALLAHDLHDVAHFTIGTAAAIVHGHEVAAAVAARRMRPESVFWYHSDCVELHDAIQALQASSTALQPVELREKVKINHALHSGELLRAFSMSSLHTLLLTEPPGTLCELARLLPTAFHQMHTLHVGLHEWHAPSDCILGSYGSKEVFGVMTDVMSAVARRPSRLRELGVWLGCFRSIRLVSDSADLAPAYRDCQAMCDAILCALPTRKLCMSSFFYINRSEKYMQMLTAEAVKLGVELESAGVVDSEYDSESESEADVEPDDASSHFEPESDGSDTHEAY